MKIIIIFIILFSITCYGQVENISILNPVYDFLLQMETKGILEHYSLSQLPLQKKTIISALKLARKYDTLLTSLEKTTLELFEKEFQIIHNETAVAIYSEMDTNSVFSSRMWKDYDKSLYHYDDSTNNVTLIPLGAIEYITKGGRTYWYLDDDTVGLASALLLGTLGLRLSGTINNKFGYYLQITNTTLRGDSSIALIDNRYATSKKLTIYHSDADISESHITYQDDWFYASFGRETRLFGAGLDQRLIINNNISPTFDAITLKAKFNTFEYTFSHNSLLNFPTTIDANGSNTIIPPKYTTIHSFTFLPSWGEISFLETMVYSRDLDMAYLNPLSFLKNLEHNLHDRDNAGMGIMAVVRPIKNLQLKASWFLDDMKLSEIGNNYWSNKTAWNVAVITSIIPNINLGLEYTRVDPYTFTHFNPQNSNTTDSILFSSTIQPNSDRVTAMLNFWYGSRYPLQIKYSYTRHGKNIYNNEGKLIKCVGGDVLDVYQFDDERYNYYVKFLDGDIEYSNIIDITAGYEIFRGFSVHLTYNYLKTNNYFRVLFRLYDF